MQQVVSGKWYHSMSMLSSHWRRSWTAEWKHRTTSTRMKYGVCCIVWCWDVHTYRNTTLDMGASPHPISTSLIMGTSGLSTLPCPLSRLTTWVKGTTTRLRWSGSFEGMLTWGKWIYSNLMSLLWPCASSTAACWTLAMIVMTTNNVACSRIFWNRSLIGWWAYTVDSCWSYYTRCSHFRRKVGWTWHPSLLSSNRYLNLIIPLIITPKAYSCLIIRASTVS